MYTRENLLDELRNLHGPGEEVEHLIDWIRDAWETRDLLTQRFGAVHAFHILNAPSPLRHWFSLNTECTQISEAISCSPFHPERTEGKEPPSFARGHRCAIVRYIIKEQI